MLFDPLALFGQALIASTCGWFFGARKGAFIYVGVIGLLTISLLLFVPGISRNAGMWVGLNLVFGIPFILGAGVLGLAGGVCLRGDKKFAAMLLISPFFLYWAATYALQLKQENEWSAVIEFVKVNPEVINLVGSNAKYFPDISGTKRGDSLPNRYEVSVNGARQIYVITDVSRDLNRTEFTIACITERSLGYRDPFKDACDQPRHAEKRASITPPKPPIYFQQPKQEKPERSD